MPPRPDAHGTRAGLAGRCAVRARGREWLGSGGWVALCGPAEFKEDPEVDADERGAPPKCKTEGGGLTISSYGATGGGGFSCQVKSAVGNLATGNFAEAPGFCVMNFEDTPRNVVVCRVFAGSAELSHRRQFRGRPRIFVWDISQPI